MGTDMFGVPEVESTDEVDGTAEEPSFEGTDPFHSGVPGTEGGAGESGGDGGSTDAGAQDGETGDESGSPDTDSGAESGPDDSGAESADAGPGGEQDGTGDQTGTAQADQHPPSQVFDEDGNFLGIAIWNPVLGAYETTIVDTTVIEEEAPADAASDESFGALSPVTVTPGMDPSVWEFQWHRRTRRYMTECWTVSFDIEVLPGVIRKATFRLRFTAQGNYFAIPLDAMQEKISRVMETWLDVYHLELPIILDLLPGLGVLSSLSEGLLSKVIGNLFRASLQADLKYRDEGEGLTVTNCYTAAADDG